MCLNYGDLVFQRAGLLGVDMGVLCCLPVKGNRVECREMEGSDAEARMRSSTSRITKYYRAHFVFAMRAWLNERYWWGKGGGR